MGGLVGAIFILENKNNVFLIKNTAPLLDHPLFSVRVFSTISVSSLGDGTHF